MTKRDDPTAYQREWRARHPNYDRRFQQQRNAYYRKRPEVYRASHYRRTYGLTIEDVERMFSEQAGLCALCREPLLPLTFRTSRSPAGRETCVDHDHRTGRVRGLLHRDCNNRLGAFEAVHDDAVRYLERFRDFAS